MFEKRVALIHAPFSGGAGTPGCELAPAVLRLAGLAPRLREAGFRVRGLRPDLGAVACAGRASLAEVAAACGQVKRSVAGSLRADELPVLLGGDHSLSIGSIAAVSEHCRRRQRPLWVLWFDAHADFNTPGTSPSGNAHGMPAAVVCGEGDPGLLALSSGTAMVDPARIGLMGVRSMDAAEATRVRRSAVGLFTMDGIRRSGLTVLIDSLLARVAASGGHLHVSLDLDVMDPGVAPGVGTPEPGGITVHEMQRSLQRIEASGLLGSIDVMEFNPLRDRGGITARLVIQMLGNLLGRSAASMSAGAVNAGGGV